MFQMPEESLLGSKIEMEQSLLGKLISSPDFINDVAWLTFEDFSEPLHQRIFHEIKRRVIAGEPCNATVLKPVFDGDPALADIGGGRYLFNLLNTPYHAFSVEDVAKEICDLKFRFDLIALCKSVSAECADIQSGRKSTDLVSSLLGESQNILGWRGNRKPKSQRDVIESVLNEMKTDAVVKSTGIPKLDDAMGGGLHAGKAYGFAARKKVGKTILAGTISYNLAKQNIKHLFVCGEMGAEEIEQRNLSRQLQVYPSTFRNGFGRSPGFLSKVAMAHRDCNDAMIYHDAPGISFDELRSVVTACVHKHKISGFILDYWQLVGGKPKNKSTAEHLDEVAQWVADFSRKHKVWSITMAQINQEGNTRGGEGLRLAFDQVYQIHREDTSAPGAWLEMMDTRYTPWVNIGSKESPGLHMNEFGPYFEQAA